MSNPMNARETAAAQAHTTSALTLDASTELHPAGLGTLTNDGRECAT